MSRPLGAQRPLTVEVGVTAAHFTDDDASVFGPSILLSMSGQKGRLFGSAPGGSLATLGAASGFATLEGGVRAPVSGGWSTELAGELGTVAGSNTSGGAGTAIANGRLLWSVRNGGAWFGAGGHASGRTNGPLTGHALASGAWWNWQRAQITATLLQEWTSAGLFVSRFRSQFVGTVPVRYAEAAVSLHAESDRTTLDLYSRCAPRCRCCAPLRTSAQCDGGILDRRDSGGRVQRRASTSRLGARRRRGRCVQRGNALPSIGARSRARGETDPGGPGGRLCGFALAARTRIRGESG